MADPQPVATRSDSGGPDDDALARFGRLLGLIGLSVVFTMAAPEADWGEAVALVLQAGVLLLAVVAVDAPRRLRRTAVGAAAGAVAVGIASLVLDPRDGTPFGAAVVAVLGIVLVAAAIAAIADHLRTAGTLTGRTVLGALCVYVLVGSLFTFVHALLAAVGPTPYFADGEPTTLASLQFFSFTTLTTVGYGDLVPATSAGRAVAMTEALVGQIYLVTIVALLVSNLTLHRTRPSPTDTPGVARPDDEDPT